MTRFRRRRPKSRAPTQAAFATIFPCQHGFDVPIRAAALFSMKRIEQRSHKPLKSRPPRCSKSDSDVHTNLLPKRGPAFGYRLRANLAEFGTASGRTQHSLLHPPVGARAQQDARCRAASRRPPTTECSALASCLLDVAARSVRRLRSREVASRREEAKRPSPNAARRPAGPPRPAWTPRSGGTAPTRCAASTPAERGRAPARLHTPRDNRAPLCRVNPGAFHTSLCRRYHCPQSNRRHEPSGHGGDGSMHQERNKNGPASPLAKSPHTARKAAPQCD